FIDKLADAAPAGVCGPRPALEAGTGDNGHRVVSIFFDVADRITAIAIDTVIPLLVRTAGAALILRPAAEPGEPHTEQRCGKRTCGDLPLPGGDEFAAAALGVSTQLVHHPAGRQLGLYYDDGVLRRVALHLVLALHLCGVSVFAIVCHI